MNKNYPISGTFIDEITYDIPSSNWDNEQWAKDLDYMKEVGIDTDNSSHPLGTASE